MALEGFAVEITPRSGHQLVVLRGELDSQAADGLAEQLVSEATSAVVVELGELTFISAAGIGALVQAKRELELDAKPLIILGAHGIVRRVFRILNLDDLLAD